MRPAYIIIAWNALTFLLYLFGPLRYYVDSQLTVTIFVTLCLFAIFLGAGFAKVRSVPRPRWKDIPNRVIIILLSMLIVRITTIIAGGALGFDVTSALEDMSNAREKVGERIDYLAIFLAPAIYGAPIIALYYWRQLSKVTKGLLLAFLFLEAFSYVLSATRAGFFYYFSIMVAISLLKVKSVWALRRYKGFVIIGIALFAIFMIYADQVSRERHVRMSFVERAAYAEEYHLDVENALFRVTPERFEDGIVTGMFYFTHAYQNLALALEMEWRGSLFGVGHSRFLTRNATRIFGENLEKYSYFFRLHHEAGMPLTRWATAYIWFASDISFVGVLGLMFLYGYFLRKTYVVARSTSNPYAAMLFAMLLYQGMTLPQVSIFQDGPMVVFFWSALVLTLLSIRAGRVRRERLSFESSHVARSSDEIR